MKCRSSIPMTIEMTLYAREPVADFPATGDPINFHSGEFYYKNNRI
jgi:hypothetical protein